MNKNTDDDISDSFASDIDSDFSEFDTGDNGKKSFGALWRENPMIKIGLVVGAFVAIVGAIVLFGGAEQKAPDSVVAGGADLKAVPGTDELSPAMVDAIEELNQTNYENAERTGGSVLPVPIDTPKDQVELQQEQAVGEDPLVRWRRMQEERLRTQQTQPTVNNEQQQAAAQARADAVNSMAQAMSNQMSQILGGRQIQNIRNMTVTDPKMLQEQQMQQIAAAQAAAATANPEKPLKIIIPATTIEYAQLLIEANSDIPGPVVAQIVTGPYAGSRVLGSFQRQKEFLTLKYNVLVKDGVSIPIDAIAIDPDTTLTGMATDVDHRYFERIILPAAARFVEGMGSAIAESGTSTSVNVNDTTVVEDNNDPDTREEFFKGVEEAASQAADQLEDEADKTEILVVVKAGTPMGVLFLQPVTDQDIDLGRMGKTKEDLEREKNPGLFPGTLTGVPGMVPAGMVPATGMPQQFIQTFSATPPQQ